MLRLISFKRILFLALLSGNAALAAPCFKGLRGHDPLESLSSQADPRASRLSISMEGQLDGVSYGRRFPLVRSPKASKYMVDAFREAIATKKLILDAERFLGAKEVKLQMGFVRTLRYISDTAVFEARGQRSERIVFTAFGTVTYQSGEGDWSKEPMAFMVETPDGSSDYSSPAKPLNLLFGNDATRVDQDIRELERLRDMTDGYIVSTDFVPNILTTVFLTDSQRELANRIRNIVNDPVLRERLRREYSELAK